MLMNVQQALMNAPIMRNAMILSLKRDRLVINVNVNLDMKEMDLPVQVCIVLYFNKVLLTMWCNRVNLSFTELGSCICYIWS